MGFFGFLKAVFSKIRGWFNSKTDAMYEDPQVMSATYDSAIANKVESFELTSDSTATLLGIKKETIQQCNELTERIERLSKIKDVATMRVKERANEIVAQCKSEGVVEKSAVQQKLLQDPEYLKHQGAFNDASSSYEEANKDFERKQKDIEKLEKSIEEKKLQLQKIQRDIDDLKQKKHSTIAETQLAKQMEQADRIASGISQNSDDEALKKVNEARQRILGRAEISNELAGNDSKLMEEEYLKYADDMESNKELEQLIDLDSMLSDENELDPAKLPE